jgi:3-octaprenyl-4-hydroxybenzoate carboxy-lyase
MSAISPTRLRVRSWCKAMKTASACLSTDLSRPRCASTTHPTGRVTCGKWTSSGSLGGQRARNVDGDNQSLRGFLRLENVVGNDMQLVTNVAGNRKLLAACLGVEPGNLPTAFRERCQKYIPCAIVGQGAWEDVVLEGDDVDLTKLPIDVRSALTIVRPETVVRWHQAGFRAYWLCCR